MPRDDLYGSTVILLSLAPRRAGGYVLYEYFIHYEPHYNPHSVSVWSSRAASDAAASASRITSLSIVAMVTALSDGHATVGAAVAHEQLGACAGENHDDGLPWFRSVSAALFGTGWTAVSASCVA